METTTRVFPDVASDSCSSSMRQRWRRGKPAEPLRLRGCAVHRAMPGSSARRRHPRLESDRDERPMGDRRSVPGPTLAVKPGEVTWYRFPNHTPLCWNATWRTDCRTVIYSNDAASTFPAETVFPVESAARWAAGPGPATRTSGPTVEAGPTDGITYSAPEFIRAGHSIRSFVDVRALWSMSS